MKKNKILILGDSISQGIGSKKRNYTNRLQKLLGENYQIKNFAYTGTTIKYPLLKLQEIINYNPDIILIMYGNVDAQLRPNLDNISSLKSKVIPTRYKMNGMLDPRPFYSRKFYRLLPDRFDNLLRKIIRWYIIKTEGLCQWVELDDFQYNYQELLNGLKDSKPKIFLISTIKLDEKYYKGSSEQYVVYNKKIKYLAEVNGCEYIDLFSYVEKLLIDYSWNDIFNFDHYHPNQLGYEFIAEFLADHILLDNVMDKENKDD